MKPATRRTPVNSKGKRGKGEKGKRKNQEIYHKAQLDPVEENWGKLWDMIYHSQGAMNYSTAKNHFAMSF
jgi:hypothetical protein